MNLEGVYIKKPNKNILIVIIRNDTESVMENTLNDLNTAPMGPAFLRGEAVIMCPRVPGQKFKIYYIILHLSII